MEAYALFMNQYQNFFLTKFDLVSRLSFLGLVCPSLSPSKHRSEAAGTLERSPSTKRMQTFFSYLSFLIASANKENCDKYMPLFPVVRCPCLRKEEDSI